LELHLYLFGDRSPPEGMRAAPDQSRYLGGGALSAAMGPGHLDEAVKAGADAVLNKVESPPTITHEVRRLAAGR
jgi:hypothetical protein